MDRLRTARWVLAAMASAAALAGGVALAQLPKEDVIDVAAVGEGLCLSNVFQANMVLQRDKPVAIWGWAPAGQEVTVSFGDQRASAVAGEDGSWEVSLAAMEADSSPRTLRVEGGGESLELDNVLVGDVWVLGGQSNMEFELAKVENGALEIVSANYPEIRILTVPAGERQDEGRSFARLQEWSSWSGRHFRKGYWEPCTPEVARELSAIGYAFARRVHKASGVPIGVIDASRGGTTVETWTPEAVLRGLDSEVVKEKLAEWDQKVAEWDAEADLAARVARHHEQVEKMKAEGREIPGDMVVPDDLRPGPIGDANYPGACYAGMISPLAGLSIKGALFHQGYNNAFEGSFGVALYRDVFPEMIKAWRGAFGDEALPFGILSLCTEGYPQTRENVVEKMYDAGVFLRAVQYETFLALYRAGDEGIGFTSTYDLRRRWYHPQVKIPAGERIARWALATQYGFSRELEWKPPMLVGMEAGDGVLVLEFDGEVGDPEDGDIEGFVISGDDGRFQRARAVYLEDGVDDRGRAKLNRKKLVLSSPLVEAPVHFRYGWARNPLANLQAMGNKDIPFATQRSDSWVLEELPLGILGDEVPDPRSRSQRGKIIEELRREDLRRLAKEAELFLEENREAIEAARAE